MKKVDYTTEKRKGVATEVASAWGRSNSFFIDHRAVGLDSEFSNPSSGGILECAEETPVKFLDADVAGTVGEFEADFTSLSVSEFLLNHQHLRSWQDGFKRTPRVAFGGRIHDGGVGQGSVHGSSPKVSAK